MGAWMGAGPWLYHLLVPGAGQSGQMFRTIQGWAAMSPAHKAILMSVCHWLPGIVLVTVGQAILVARRSLLTAVPSRSRPAETA